MFDCHPVSEQIVWRKYATNCGFPEAAAEASLQNNQRETFNLFLNYWKQTGKQIDKLIYKNDRRSSGGTLRQQKTWLNLIWASISIHQHHSALISINQHQSASITIKHNQSASVGISQHQSTFEIDLATVYTGVNAPNFWGAWGGYREILRSMRRLCEQVGRGWTQELLSELTNRANAYSRR